MIHSDQLQGPTITQIIQIVCHNQCRMVEVKYPFKKCKTIRDLGMVFYDICTCCVGRTNLKQKNQSDFT